MEPYQQEMYLERLRTLVNIDSSSFDPDGVDRMAGELRRWYEALGLWTTLHRFDPRAGSCLEVRTHPEDEKIDVLFSGHMDTVFPKGTAERRGFTMDAEQAYGPGVIDMKAGLVSMYEVVRQLHARLPELRLCLALNGDEEISSRYSNPWLSSLAAHGTCGLVFEPGRVNGDLVSSRKGLARYRVELRGIAAHAGVNPQKGASAIHEAALWITELVPRNDYEHGTSLNVGLIQGGLGANTVADRCSFEVDTRFRDPAAGEALADALEKLTENPHIPGVTAQVTRLGYRPPMIPGEKAETMMEALLREAETMELQVQFAATGGGSDGNFLSAAGCPVLDALGPVGDRAHCDDEYLCIDTVEPRINLVLRTLLRLEDQGFFL